MIAGRAANARSSSCTRLAGQEEGSSPLCPYSFTS
jgi:hypothetical protein